jgi:Helix-hairpin-helix motif
MDMTPEPHRPRSLLIGGRVNNSIWSLLWALVPFVSLGLLTPITIGYAAFRIRSVAVALTAVPYTIGIVTVMVGTDAYGDNPPAVIDALMTVSILAAWFAGTAQAFALRRAFQPRSAFSQDPHAGRAITLTAEQEVLRRRELRARSRQLSKNDPGLAKELRIGRPDLPRTYDDGGLIDINHAPESALTAVAAITPGTARQIVQLREQGRVFISAEDLAAAVDLDPTMMPLTAEHTVYLD